MKYVFKSQKLVYFIKDLVFYLFLIGIGFILGTKSSVSADSMLDYSKVYSYFRELNYTSLNEPYDSYENELKRLAQALQNAADLNENKDYAIVIGMFSANSSPTQNPTLKVYDISSINSFYSTGNGWFKTSQQLNYFDYELSRFSTGKIDAFTDYVEENMSLPDFGSGYYEYFYPKKTTYLDFGSGNPTTDASIIYYTTKPLVYEGGNYDSIKLTDDIIINKNSEFKTYLDLIKMNQEYMYSVDDIDHIDIIFDLDNIPSDSLIGDNNEYFKFKMGFEIKTVNQDKTNADVLFNPPSIEYNMVLENGTTSYSSTPLSKTRKSLYNTYYDSNEYTNQFFSDYDYPRSLKMSINVRDINNTYIYFKISPTLDYTIKIHKRDEVEDSTQYYDEIKMDGNYAALFIPKIRKDGNINSVNSYFISNGNYQVQERDTYETEYTLYVDPKRIQGSNQYYYFYTPSGTLHEKDSFYYLNLDYFYDTTDYKILYDTRYFVVSLCVTPLNCETIQNPNTGEIITPLPPEEIKNKKTISDFLKDTSDFVEEQSGLMFQFSRITNYFFNSIPTLYQKLIITLSILLLIFVIIKIARS